MENNLFDEVKNHAIIIKSKEIIQLKKVESYKKEDFTRMPKLISNELM